MGLKEIKYELVEWLTKLEDTDTIPCLNQDDRDDY